MHRAQALDTGGGERAIDEMSALWNAARAQWR
jgi:hypothetical protein